MNCLFAMVIQVRAAELARRHGYGDRALPQHEQNALLREQSDKRFYYRNDYRTLAIP